LLSTNFLAVQAVRQQPGVASGDVSHLQQQLGPSVREDTSQQQQQQLAAPVTPNVDAETSQSDNTSSNGSSHSSTLVVPGEGYKTTLTLW
jgi:hypothetical protein